MDQSERAETMWNVLVTGTNRGIGLEFVRQLSAQEIHPQPTNIIAICRDPENAQELRNIKESAKVKVHILKLDICNDADIARLPATVQNLIGPDQKLNLLINNAGYGPTLTLEQITREEMDRIFSVNVTSPIMVTKALIPLLRAAAVSGMSCYKSAVINISSVLGSFSVPVAEDGHRLRTLMAYNSSKAALNMLTRYLAKDLLPMGIMTILLHPGWVKTDMGSSAAPLTPQESISDMLTTIRSFNENHHGGFFDQNGNVIPW